MCPDQELGPAFPCPLEPGLLSHCSGPSLPGRLLVAAGERPGWGRGQERTWPVTYHLADSSAPLTLRAGHRRSVNLLCNHLQCTPFPGPRLQQTGRRVPSRLWAGCRLLSGQPGEGWMVPPCPCLLQRWEGYVHPRSSPRRRLHGVGSQSQPSPNRRPDPGVWLWSFPAAFLSRELGLCPAFRIVAPAWFT